MAGYIKNSNGTYSVNYDDERFQAVEDEKNNQLNETTNMYDNMINNTDKFYQDQINASKEWAEQQNKLQQEQTDLTIEQINQQKEKAEKDYTKEQKASYADYMKQINPYSVNAETMATNGLQNTGYSESSRVSMWNTYQNRYATARESYNNAILNYDNGIKEAQLANSSALAEIAYNALQQQLELSLEGFQYKNTLIQQKEAQIQQVNETYNNRYQQVLAQINAEIDRQMQIDELVEKHKQWTAEFEAASKQREIERAQWEKEYKLKEKEAERNYQLALAQERRAAAAVKSSSGSYTVSGSSSKSLSANAQKILNMYKTSQSNNGIIGKMLGTAASKGIRPYILAQYNAGNISNSDAEILFERLGL